MYLPDPRWEEPNLLLPGKKPTGPVVLDRTNTLTNGLWFGLFLTEGNSDNRVRDLVGVNDLVLAGTASSAPPQAVSLAASTKTNLWKATAVNAQALGATDEWTYTFKFIPHAYVSLAGYFGISNMDLPLSSTPGQTRFMLSYNNNYYFWGASRDFDTGISFDTDSKPHTISFMYRDGQVHFFRDGVHRAQGTISSGLNTITTPKLYIGGGHNGMATAGNFDFLFGMAHSRAMSDAEIRSLHDNPYQVLVPA